MVPLFFLETPQKPRKALPVFPQHHSAWYTGPGARPFKRKLRCHATQRRSAQKTNEAPVKAWKDPKTGDLKPGVPFKRKYMNYMFFVFVLICFDI